MSAGPDSSALAAISKDLTSLERAQRLQDLAAIPGFDWPDMDGPLNKLDEEWIELRQEIEKKRLDRIRSEFGDLLFTVVALARHLGVEAEVAMAEANQKFERRFRAMESLDPTLAGGSLAGMDLLWERVKAAERSAAVKD